MQTIFNLPLFGLRLSNNLIFQSKTPFIVFQVHFTSLRGDLPLQILAGWFLTRASVRVNMRFSYRHLLAGEDSGNLHVHLAVKLISRLLGPILRDSALCKVYLI